MVVRMNNNTQSVETKQQLLMMQTSQQLAPIQRTLKSHPG